MNRLLRALALSGGSALAMAMAAAPATARETVTFAAAVFAESGRGDSFRAWVNKFNESQDEVEIEPVSIPFATLASTVFTQMGAGGGPDLIRFDQTDFFAAVPSGRVRPLEEFIDETGYDFLAPDRYMKIDGVRYGLLFDITGHALIYNTDLTTEVPEGFDDFLAKARENTADGNFGYAYRATMAAGPGFWQDICNFVFGFGGRWSDADGNVTLNSPEVVKGITAYKAVYDANVIPKGADGATNLRMFGEGKIAYYIHNGGVAEIVHQSNPDIPFKVAHSPFPDPAQGLIMTALVINANASQEKAEAAAKFIKWAYEPANQADLLEVMGTNVGTRVEFSDELLAERPWLPVYEEQLAHTLPQLIMGHEGKTIEISQIIMEQVLEVLQSGLDPQTAMDRAQQIVERRILR